MNEDTDVWTVYQGFWTWAQITFGKGTTEKMYDCLTDGDDPHAALHQFIKQVTINSVTKHGTPTDNELIQLVIHRFQFAARNDAMGITDSHLAKMIVNDIRVALSSLPPIPEIPEGWELACFEAMLTNSDDHGVIGEGPTWQEALSEACAMASGEIK